MRDEGAGAVGDTGEAGDAGTGRRDGGCARPRRGARAWLVAALAAAAWPAGARAASMEVLASLQRSPGNVVVSVRLPDAASAPDKNELVMRLEGRFDVAADKVVELPPELPAWIVLCLDRSGSLSADAVAELRSTVASSLQHDANGEMPYKVAVISFATDIQAGPTFSSNTRDVAAAIDAVQRERNPAGKTRLYDATSGALANLRGKPGGKRLILVSDGKDEGSVLGLDGLKQRARADGFAIPIDTIAFGSESAAFGGSLSELAGSTGGRFDSAGNARELGDDMRRLLVDINDAHSRYEASFVYKPGKAGRVSTSSQLIYTASGGSPMAQPLHAPIVAAVDEEPVSPIAGEPGTTWYEWFEEAVKFFSELPALIKAITALLAVLTTVFAAQKAANVVHNIYIHFHDPTRPPPGDDGKREPKENVVPTNPPRRNRTQVMSHVWPVPGGGRAIAILRGIEGSVRGRSAKVDKASFTIGAGEDNDLVLVGDGHASAHHARLRVESGNLYVQDLGSTNGSYLNDERFTGETKGLSPGDTLRFGRSSFEVAKAP